MSTLGRLLGLQTRTKLELGAIEALSSFCALEPWLIVFDNAPDAFSTTESSALLEWFRRLRGTGHVLITSRGDHFDGVASTLAVTRFSRTEATDFLLRRTKQKDREAAENLAERLDGLALALENAVAYMNAGDRTSLDAYLRIWQEKLRHTPKGARDYKLSVWAALMLSLDQVAASSSDAYYLLCVFAWLSPELIDKQLVFGGSNGDSCVELHMMFQDSTVWNDTQDVLRSASVIEHRRSDGVVVAYQMHRMMSHIIRERMASDAEPKSFKAACELIESAASAYAATNNDPECWAHLDALLPHARSLFERHSRFPPSQMLGRILSYFGDYLRIRGHYDDSHEFLASALNIATALYGAEHPEVSEQHSKLAMLFRQTGRYEAARTHIEKALESDLKTFTPDHVAVAVRRGILASILRNLGEPALAKEQISLALQLERTQPRHPLVAVGSSILANVLHDLGEHEDARRRIEFALAADTRDLGPKHPNIAVYRSILGKILASLGELNQARAQIEAALEADLMNFGEDHTFVALRRSTLANIFVGLGMYEEANAQIRKALVVLVVKLSENHPELQFARSVDARIAMRNNSPSGAP